MTIRGLLASATVAACLAVVPAIAAELKSGPQAEEKLAGPFHPLNINGKAAGEKHCLYCSNGNNPVAMVFARTPNESISKLVKQLDQATEANKKAEMGSFVVFLNDKEGLDKQLKEIADKEKLKNVVLSIDNPAGPKGYKVNEEADVTVVLYVNRTVKANYAFKKGELKDGDIEKIVKDVSKIVK